MTKQEARLDVLSQAKRRADGSAWLVPIGLLREWKDNPDSRSRRSIAALKDSIERAGAVLLAAHVQFTDDGRALEVLSGNRRYRASRQLGHTWFPVLFDMDGLSVDERHLLSNAPVDLTPLPKMNNLRWLMEESTTGKPWGRAEQVELWSAYPAEIYPLLRGSSKRAVEVLLWIFRGDRMQISDYVKAGNGISAVQTAWDVGEYIGKIVSPAEIIKAKGNRGEAKAFLLALCREDTSAEYCRVLLKRNVPITPMKQMKLLKEAWERAQRGLSIVPRPTRRVAAKKSL